jgi:hypothetical protein
MSQQGFSRLDALSRLQSGLLRVSDACVLIGPQRHQLFRLPRGLEQDGPANLLSRRRGRPSNHRLPAEVRTLALSNVRERYADIGPTLGLRGGFGGEKADRASRLLGVTRDPARLDDCGRAGAGPSAWSSRPHQPRRWRDWLGDPLLPWSGGSSCPHAMGQPKQHRRAGSTVSP